MSRAWDKRQIISIPGRPATWEDLDKVPEGAMGEIVAGEIHVIPRPDWPHAKVASDLGGVLVGAFRFGGGGGPGGWVILHEPGIRFGEDIRIPDLAGWRKERWTGIPRRGPIPLAPDWIAEVLSPRTETTDRTSKLKLYARARVGHVWLLGPVTRTLEVYRLEDGGWHLAATHAGDEKVRVPPFDAIELDLALLWPDLPPDPDDE